MRLTKSLILLLFVATLGFSFTSCSDDEDDAQNRDLGKFAGTWELQTTSASVGLTSDFKKELEAAKTPEKIKEYEDALKAGVEKIGAELKPAAYVLSADGKFEYTFNKVVEGKATAVKQSGTYKFDEFFTGIILTTTSEQGVSDKAYILGGTSLKREEDRKTEVVNTISGLNDANVDKALLALVFSLKK